MNEEAALWSFLDWFRTSLRAMRDDQKALRFSLRQTCDHFKVKDACLAVLLPGRPQAEMVSVIPRGGEWNLDLLTAFLTTQRVQTPQDTIMAPINRRGRLWAVLALRTATTFERPSARALSRISRVISESIEYIDWQRIVEVRSR